jgi:GTP diphosphokinase / guanosine-3',5'-bis(diphosphate) 3'-diphosphatase
MMETELLDKAIALAQTAHANQVDKAGAPYIGHPLRVMNSLSTVAEKIVGVLHDSIEDSELTLIFVNFSLPIHHNQSSL